tara:strand:+ start:758 stop:1135 length:378 start_codon:yes stop_codon:yes gene_type:complete
MIKELQTKDIRLFIMQNSDSVLVDVRTEHEWNNIGKPDGKEINLKTYFLSIKNNQGEINENFLDEFKKLDIRKETEVLVICKSGARSLLVSNLLNNQDYQCINIIDGFEGNEEGKGWKNEGLPII